ncbi:MAG TPA: Asp-tRNA(Asn)/Glu-tRNA(Gln) amidotransferase subunit GatC [Candidatus Limnocylindrales bacterium]|jgi:aspartyl-tRNA(Asn)/glutamyl-tRNA(Gln) amidotransferase subunit C|nr:Asp-tRNA(Asn)/Glu-tRNA(Gln) amidotransferase subunit GatC [Candidatus Limnocylindrales bacterium]
MAELSREDVAHVALLARLGLDEAEVEAYRRQLNHIVEQYAILSELDTAAIPPTAQVIELENVLRDDVPEPGLTLDQALAGAPERIGDHLVVPAILDARG